MDLGNFIIFGTCFPSQTIIVDPTVPYEIYHPATRSVVQWYVLHTYCYKTLK